MRKLFTSLLLFSALEANEKNGFFIETGFETGLLEGTQTQEKRHTTTKNTYATYDYLPTDTILKRAANLFTNTDITKLKFSTKNPVSVHMGLTNPNPSNGAKSKVTMVVENFLPYNLNNVRLFFKDNKGKVIDLGVLETIPKHSKIVLPENIFDKIKLDDPYFFPTFEATSTSISDTNTQRVFETLNKIKTDLVVNYRNENKFKDHENHWEAFTPQTAEEFTNLMLNMIAVLDSQSWGDAILNAPFEFTNKGGGGECDTSKENDCVNPGTNGLVNSQNKSYVLNKQDIVNKFRNKADLDVIVLKDSGVVGLGSDITPSNNDDGKHYGQLGVVASALDPKKLFGNDLKTINLADLRTILHEFSHTKGYTHNGNMTYQRVPTGQNENGKPKDSDGLPYNVCSLYGGSNQPAFPSNYPNSIYHNCADVPAGFLGVTAAVWQQLINQNALPIDYANLSAQTNYNLNASLNTQDLANSMLSTIQKTFVTSSVTNHFSSASQSFRSPILGVNAKIGYQNYFNDFIGLAYYGIVKYNYSKALNQKFQQLSYGGGIDLLLDFITTYSNKNSPIGVQTRRNFSSSFGIFGGLRGLYNSYYVLNKVKGSGNLDVATGLNYRYKHSKYSVGISIPLIQRKASVVSSGSDYTNSFVFNEGASHFKVFFNYGWVF
ncbi:membrane protein [Helicobacter pylori]|uniref:HomA n=1 Tax=Helicobacter pylori Hp H-24 TaxID=992039 RepID=J0KL40_HELPX|nr:membrane protein [Helicobacter pylori]EJB51357.1 homA [Helicobacter pylori Hp H-24]EJC16991.1 outer membrane protein family protein [Helicobacter pylori Hp H-24b]EJC19142.1 outer membrane protein family protein [Helicobacter pylori Hp H-24c]EJC38007.1 homA [Helicobacter pylori Hp M1]EJC38239.1 homA [Helicobacter pylori Hp M1]